MGFFPRAVDKMLGMEPFAHEATLHVDTADQDGIVSAVRYPSLERVEV